MKIFNNGILCLTEVHGLLHNPKDLSKEQFNQLVFFLTIRSNNIIFCKKTFTAVIHCGIATSNGDVRRMIKSNALSIGPRKITSIEDELDPTEFFETGFDGLKWSTVRNGKKKAELILIQHDESLEDPWFGMEYEEWKNDLYIIHMLAKNLKI